VLLAFGLPVIYTPTMFNGLSGQISSSRLPHSWAQVQSLTAARTGALLFLPWHEYLSFPFTDGRVIDNPAPTSFTGAVISGTNPELPGLPDDSSPSSEAIKRAVTGSGQFGHGGSLMTLLGVQYVVLAKTVDWQSYRWLFGQQSLHLVFASPALALWENRGYSGIGARRGVPLTRLSPVAYRIPSGPPGPVTVAIAFQPGWSLNNVPAQPTAQGTVKVWAGSKGGVLRFGPWRLVVIGDLMSGLVLCVLVVVLVLSKREKQLKKFRQ
jgi:hypothetical protein